MEEVGNRAVERIIKIAAAPTRFVFTFSDFGIYYVALRAAWEPCRARTIAHDHVGDDNNNKKITYPVYGITIDN